MEQEHERLVADALVAYRQSWTALRQASEATWTQLELTVSQLKALLLIEARDFMTISEVADMMGIGRSSASILIDQLVQLSLVNRTEDQTDRRRTLVSLTEQAHDLAGRLYQCDQEYMHALFERIGDDDLRALRGEEPAPPCRAFATDQSTGQGALSRDRGAPSLVHGTTRSA